MDFFDEKVRQMQTAIDCEVMQAMHAPPNPKSPISKAVASLGRYLKDEHDLLMGRPVTLEDGRIALRLPIPYDKVAVFKPMAIDDLLRPTF